MKSVQRSEHHYKSGHALECSVSEGQPVGLVRASINEKTNRVVVSFESLASKVADMSCTNHVVLCCIEY